MTRTSTPSSTASGMTTGQQEKFARLIKDIVDHCGTLATQKVGADTEGWQLVLENGDELKRVTAEAFVGKARELSTPNQFENEEVRSSYDYPPEFKGPKPIAEQIKMLADIFGLDPSHALKFAQTLGKHPDGTDGWYAFVTDKGLGRKHFPEIEDPALRYCRAVDLMLEKIGRSRKFTNYRQGQITPDRLRRTAKTLAALEQLSKEQEGDIIIVAAQFGRKYRGKSVRRARVLIRKNEFGFGALEVGCMVLTHQERYVRWEQLHTDCPGDEFSENADGQFDLAPLFSWDGGKLEFVMGWFNCARDHYGSVSGLLPQST